MQDLCIVFLLNVHLHCTLCTINFFFLFLSITVLVSRLGARVDVITGLPHIYMLNEYINVSSMNCVTTLHSLDRFTSPGLCGVKGR